MTNDVFGRARELIESLEQRLSANRSTGSLEECLQERAARLSARRAAVVSRTPLAEVFVARRGTSLFGLPVEAAVEVRRVPIVPLPHASSTLQALFHVRGQAMCLVDLHRVLTGKEPEKPEREALVLVARIGPGDLGLRIDEAVGTRVVFEDECDEPLQRRCQEFVTAVTRDLVSVLDPHLLAARPELTLRSGL